MLEIYRQIKDGYGKRIVLEGVFVKYYRTVCGTEILHNVRNVRTPTIRIIGWDR